MKKKHILTKILLCFLMAVLFIPSTSQTANAAVNKKQPTKATLTSAKATSYNKVSLKWKKSKNITSYAVYYKASNSKKWVKIANVSSKKTGYTHKSSKKYPLKQGKTYQYRIRGYNKNAKGSKKWGKYSSTKKVKIPKKAAAKPTEAPNPTVKPTEAPKPTAAPQPTTAPKPTAAPKPKATPIPKPTAIPQPTKPAQPAKPTATPIPKPTAIPKPTEAPKPTAVPQPRKAPQPTATPKPTTTPASKPTAAPTATPTPNPEQSNVELVTLEGGKGKVLAIRNNDYAENIVMKDIVFTFDNSSDVISQAGVDIADGIYHRITIRAQKKGSVVVKATYNGRLLKQWTVNVTSDWNEYIGYYNWRRNTESQIWTNSMSVVQKLDAARDYIKTNFKYGSYGSAVYSWGDENVNRVIDCITASEFMGDFAKDLGLRVGYVNMNTQKIYDYLVEAYSAADGHIYNVIMLDGSWVGYDAQPPHV